MRLKAKSHHRPGLLAGLPTLLALVALQVVLPARGAEISPAGLWKTIDDKTHKPRGTVRIYEDNGLWFGRVESSFNPAEQLANCDKCSDARRGQPVIGMVIMRGLSKHGSEYSGGDILDPEIGTVYRCRFSLSANGQKLLVRGFIGISILGRTQTWIRLEESARKNQEKILAWPPPLVLDAHWYEIHAARLRLALFSTYWVPTLHFETVTRVR